MFSEWLLSPLKSHLKNANIVHIKQAPKALKDELGDQMPTVGDYYWLTDQQML